jgi:hypothetical protein
MIWLVSPLLHFLRPALLPRRNQPDQIPTPRRQSPPPMAARRAPHVISLHGSTPPLLGRAPGSSAAPARDEASSPVALARHPAVAAIEGRLVARDEDIQDLLIDNQRFAATHVALQQQLIAAQHELRAVSVAATRARAEREGEVAALAEQAAHIEAEARAVAAAREEVDRVHADVQVLAAARVELVNRLQGLREQLGPAQAEAGKMNTVRAQIETMRREIQKGRYHCWFILSVRLTSGSDECAFL